MGNGDDIITDRLVSLTYCKIYLAAEKNVRGSQFFGEEIFHESAGSLHSVMYTVYVTCMGIDQPMYEQNLGVAILEADTTTDSGTSSFG